MHEPKFEFDPDLKNYVVKGPTQQQVTYDILMAFRRDVEGKIRAALIELGWTPPEGITVDRGPDAA